YLIILAYTCLFIDDACGVRSDRLFGKTFWFTEYRRIDGIKLRVPEEKICHPKQEYLKQRFEQCKWYPTV
ncbi:MAG: hypothetical protein V7L01_18700, partial [Nostoc sp.]|uniref:hypothetical protein n=1 Tax=Nostoc sp. TaxID=1180 RepID=UPI002FF94626